MAPRSIGLDDALSAYVAAHSTKPDDVRRRLIERTEALGDAAGMQIAPEQGEFLTMLTSLVQARFAVEVGTFTGYSALSIASGLAEGGRLLCCDVSTEWTDIAREHWALAGVDDRIDLRVAPAIETLRALPADTVVDFAFIDADKGGYLDYYEEFLDRLAPGGLICVDNTLWSGAVVDPDIHDADTRGDPSIQRPRGRRRPHPSGDRADRRRPHADPPRSGWYPMRYQR
jgi:caffeoyl-CoA O-methyltransferase